MSTDPDSLRARKLRSLAIALGLVVFVILVFSITFVRLQANGPAQHF